MPWSLPEGVCFVLDRLETCGFRADIVGGCVRDRMRGVEAHDYDITTDATPEQMQAVFHDMRTIETGIRHGTLTVLYKNEPYEITTYRTEGTYTDHRHPDGVSFSRQLSDDLCRRDFTVNAMCYHPVRGVTDLYGGQDDLRRRLLRCVGDPERRLEEDALRILRALRFSSVLDFSIEEATARAIHEKKQLLHAVSAERIYIELKKLLMGVRVTDVLMQYRDVLDEIVPTLRDLPLSLSALPMLPTVELRFCALFAAAPDAEERFLAACDRLRTDRALRRTGEQLLPLVKSPTGDRRDLLRCLFSLGEEGTEQLLLLRYALGTDAHDRREELRKRYSG